MRQFGMVRVLLGVVMASLAGVACDVAPDQNLSENDLAAVSPDVRPNGRGTGIANQWAKAGGGAPTSNGIRYHGGPVMLGATKVYYIWYGDWSGARAGSNATSQAILTDLAGNIGGSGYYNINTTYYNAAGTKVSNSVQFAGATTDAYSRGTSLTDAAIQGVVSDAINSGRLPKDTSGVYFVLTSDDVTASSGFCTKYCGWHTHATIAGSDIKYSFVGNPVRCPSSCSMQQTPNGDLAGDGMASIVSHELEEAVTDPDLNAWYDSRGYENADKCAWTFGTQSGPAGAQYNMTIGARNYLIQRNWVNASGGYCAVSY